MKIYGASQACQKPSSGEKKSVSGVSTGAGQPKFASLSLKADTVELSKPKAQASQRVQPFKVPRFAGRNELHEAAEKGDHIALRTVLRSNPEFLNEQDENGNTPLHLAVKGGHVTAVRVLLGRPGIAIHQANFEQLKPLDMAYYESHKLAVHMHQALDDLQELNVDRFAHLNTVIGMLEKRQGIPADVVNWVMNYRQQFKHGALYG